MANTYTPYDLKIKAVLGDTVIITWDVHNAVQHKAGTKYNIYTSASGAASSFVLLKKSVRTENSVPLTDDNRFIRISCVAPVLGESDRSASLEIIGPNTLSDLEAQPVAVDGNNKSRNLLVDSETGKLEVETEIDAASLVGLSTEAKQDAQIALLTAIHNNTAPGLAKETKQDTAIVNQIAQLDLLHGIKDNTEVGNIRIEDGELLSVGPTGKKIALPFYKIARIKQVTVLHEFGADTEFIVRVWNKNPATSERNVLMELPSYGERRVDIIKTVPYINQDNAEEITIEVIPENGTSNNFFVRVSGSLAY